MGTLGAILGGGVIGASHPRIWAYSSRVEHSAYNGEVSGSNPDGPTCWCSSTAEPRACTSLMRVRFLPPAS